MTSTDEQIRKVQDRLRDYRPVANGNCLIRASLLAEAADLLSAWLEERAVLLAVTAERDALKSAISTGREIATGWFDPNSHGRGGI